MGVCARRHVHVCVSKFFSAAMWKPPKKRAGSPLWQRVVSQDGGGAAGKKKRRRREEARLRSRCRSQGLARRYLSSWATGIQEGESEPSDRPGLDERGKVDGVCQ